MRLFTNLIRRILREYFYLLTTIPVAFILFGLVQFGFSQSPLPIAVLLALALLTVMQWVAKFEIKRTNGILKTDFIVIENWFGNPFFSWAGAKERVTSIRSWMAIVYILLIFGIAIVGALSSTILLIGLILVFVASGILSVTWLNQTVDFPSSLVNGASTVEVQLRILGEPNGFRFDLIEYQPINSIPVLTSFSTSNNISLTILIGFVVAMVALWLIIQMARSIPRFVDGLLSGTYLPQIENTLKQLSKEFNVSERIIREAINSESLQPRLSDLSKREIEILALMAQGKSNAGIAKSLYITEGSVEKHISSILSKLNLRVEEDNHRRVLAVLTYLGIDPKPKAK